MISFCKGAMRIFDLSNSFSLNIEDIDDNETALRKDWEKVGCDMRKAMVIYK